MNGSAPNSPATGSHVLVRRKPNWNLARDGPEWLHSSHTSKAVSAKIAVAQRKTTTCARLSPLKARFSKEARRKRRACGRAAVAMLLYFSDSFRLLRHNFFRERSVAE